MQKLPLQLPDPLPPEILTLQAERQAISTLDGEKTSNEDIDRDEVICMVRPLFSDGAEYERDTAISKLASQIGLEEPNSLTRAEIDSVLRDAMQRGILAGDVLQLSARSIGDYGRDHLKAQFLTSLPEANWIERDDAIRRLRSLDGV